MYTICFELEQQSWAYFRITWMFTNKFFWKNEFKQKCIPVKGADFWLIFQNFHASAQQMQYLLGQKSHTPVGGWNLYFHKIYLDSLD